MIKKIVLAIILTCTITLNGAETKAVMAPILSYLLSDSSVKDGERLEAYGANAFYKPFYGTLHVRPNGDGTSTVQSTIHTFTSEYLNKEFVAFRINKNSDVMPEDRSFFPNVIGSRYSKVIEVVNASTLIVDFEYNGGDSTNPKDSLNASGYFFFDNKAAFIRAITDANRSEDIVLKSGGVYAIKGVFDVITPSDVRIKTEDGFSKKARIKISAEDVAGGYVDTGNDDSGVFKERMFNLNNDDFDIRFENVNILGPHYTVPTGGGSYVYSAGLFGGNDYTKQSARVLELFGSDDWTEYYELRDNDLLKYLPDGYNFVGPSFIKGILYGGKHDGTDITDMIYLNCIQSSMHVASFSSMKSNVSAGIYKRIIGKSPTEMSEVIELDIPENRINLVKLSGEEGAMEVELNFSADSLTSNANRRVEILGSGSWYQFASQYWESGTSRASTNPILILVDGFRLYFGNRGDFDFEYGNKGAMPFDNGRVARMFNRIPKVNDVLEFGGIKDFKDIEKFSDKEFDFWGWGMQVGDEVEIDSQTYRVVSTKRVNKTWYSVDPENHSSNHDKAYNYVHVDRVTFDKTVVGNLSTAKIVKSNTEYLLSGSHSARVIYDRDYNGHLFYDDFNFPYHFENVIIKGYFRGSDKPTDGHLYKMPPVEKDGYAKRWVNVIYSDDNPNPQHWLSKMLKNRALAEGKDENAYPILIKGPYTSLSQFYPADPTMDTVKIVGNPDISGGRIVNPIIEGSVKSLKNPVAIQITNGVDVYIDTLELSSDDLGYGGLRYVSSGATLHVNKILHRPSTTNVGDVFGTIGLNVFAGYHYINDEDIHTSIAIQEMEGTVTLYDKSAVSGPLPYSVEIDKLTEKKGIYAGYGFGMSSSITKSKYPDMCEKIHVKDENGTSLVESCP